ncbi:MAG: A24 family peptidase [Gammaproteobacteria bacterium]
MSFISLLQTNPTIFILFAGLIGLIVGSFLNVVIYRLPLMMERDWKSQCRELLDQQCPDAEKQDVFNLSKPRSKCPKCDHAITAIENIPVLSYLIQGGKCKGCGDKISARYPLVEILTAVLTAVVAWRFGFGWAALGGILFTWALIVLSGIDLDTQLLPDSITLPFLWLGIAFNMFGTFTDLQSSIIGAMAGYLALWSVYWLFKLVTGKEGMGFGDFKLLGMIGAWLGWQVLPLTIILSSVAGTAVGISLILFKSHGRQQPIPFGPYLAIAGWIALCWGQDLIDIYLRTLY